MNQKKDQKNNMYTETVEYWDDLYPESYVVVLSAYNLKLLKAKKTDDCMTEITVSSAVAEDLKRFLDDLEEGDLDPLDVVSRECKYDDDYIARLKKMIKNKT